MDFFTKLNKKGLWALVGILVLVIIILTFSRGGDSAPAGDTSENQAPKAAAPSSPSPKPTTPSSPPKTTAPKTAPRSSISFLAPIGGAEWIIGEFHEIKWSREAGVSGYLSLLDAKTKALVGVVNPSLGPHQTSYEWNAKIVAFSRTDPSRKEITTGSYIMMLKFDGPQGGVESAPFSIINASQAKIPTHSVAIKNFALDPANLTVKKGDKIVFINNDAVTHQLRIASFTPYTLAAGESLTFDTGILFPSTYDLYSDLYSSLRGTVTVQQ